ncbi:methyltransferase-like protein 22 isoform X1 [Ochotona princeps]|uniref:methyltransferase-like protein 22 isoform X1 n=1 Tax=Ochotona princeps TaxID=9978 RepID=UPI002715419D|nr:methyltransferase-like protein 22 isoform X1 [Ochotona princeps]XP_058536882.1 methyltransferase-like protein 22 isoform X1 [Ochotona princeps]
MDEITFRSDTVLSDVHLYTPNHRHLMVRLNAMGQPVFLSQFKLLWSRDAETDPGAEGARDTDGHAQGAAPGGGCSTEGFSLWAGAGAQLDEDGDLAVKRRPRAASDPDPAEPRRAKVRPMVLTQQEDHDVAGGDAQDSSPQDVIKIEHTMATPLEDVGKQVWRGALLLADYILSQRDLFEGRTVLELGAGTGLASIVAATMAQTVYCTDVGADLLAMCQRNIALNSHLAAAGGTVKVKELDWLKDELCTDPEVPFSWSEEDISDLYAHTTVLLAAEVFYDDDLTDALFKTLSRLAHRFRNACTAILSVEKRLNFTLRHLDVTCEAYDHFRASLEALERLAGGPLRFMVEPVEASFPQRLLYERIQQLELWKIVAEPAT